MILTLDHLELFCPDVLKLSPAVNGISQPWTHKYVKLFMLFNSSDAVPVTVLFSPNNFFQGFSKHV